MLLPMPMSVPLSTLSLSECSLCRGSCPPIWCLLFAVVVLDCVTVLVILPGCLLVSQSDSRCVLSCASYAGPGQGLMCKWQVWTPPRLECASSSASPPTTTRGCHRHHQQHQHQHQHQSRWCSSSSSSSRSRRPSGPCHRPCPWWRVARRRGDTRRRALPPPPPQTARAGGGGGVAAPRARWGTARS